MKTRLASFVVVCAAAFSLGAAARAETADEAFARGKQLLAKGDFDGALRAYGEAARGAGDNAEYRKQYALVRRIADLRERLDAEQDLERWEYLARALHSFYYSEDLTGEALALARRAHAKLSTSDTAELLGETELALGRDADAAKTLGGLDPAKATPMTKALLGVALARQGRTDEARKVAQSLVVPAEADARIDYAAARMHGALGDAAASAAALTRAFEAMAPSRLDGFKAHAKACPDFAAVKAAPPFAQALAAKSKVAESECSGGSGCAGCPLRGNCGKQGQ